MITCKKSSMLFDRFFALLLQEVDKCVYRRAHRLTFMGNFSPSKYKAMKIVLNKENPTAVLVIAALNAAAQGLPAVDEQTSKPTITPGSVGVKFQDGDDPAVVVTQSDVNEFKFLFSKNTAKSASLFAVATALNENGDIVKSDPLEIVVEADPIGDGLAVSLAWKLQSTPPDTTMAQPKAAVYKH